MKRRSLFHDDASGRRSRRKGQNSEMDLDITPMIDVTFLLLIFFMVASTMQPIADNDVPPARHGVGIETAQSTIITIREPETVDGDPVVALGAGGSEGASMDEVADYVRRGLDEGRNRVILKADRDLPHGFVQRVARAANTVEGIRFFIGIRDKNAR